MSSHKPVRLMTPDEAAGFLSVSTRTLKRLVAEGALGAIKIRGSMRFKLEDLEAFIGPADGHEWHCRHAQKRGLWPHLSGRITS